MNKQVFINVGLMHLWSRAGPGRSWGIAQFLSISMEGLGDSWSLDTWNVDWDYLCVPCSSNLQRNQGIEVVTYIWRASFMEEKFVVCETRNYKYNLEKSIFQGNNKEDYSNRTVQILDLVAW